MNLEANMLGWPVVTVKDLRNNLRFPRKCVVRKAIFSKDLSF